MAAEQPNRKKAPVRCKPIYLHKRYCDDFTGLVFQCRDWHNKYAVRPLICRACHTAQDA